MIVKNDSKAVIVLKAIGLPALRLFPGYNTVDQNDIEKYFFAVMSNPIDVMERVIIVISETPFIFILF